ncbi:hypothetical protein AYI69_g10363 [Smittium culicis]|uniref:Uncharacterized protein n=1 Tax=Smittium culicis TaxID=133412 RepID=A0A1R1X6B4_9FUNG|nr:hypothetical protein AYI69_g10363 [Smittium culicis]
MMEFLFLFYNNFFFENIIISAPGDTSQGSNDESDRGSSSDSEDQYHSPESEDEKAENKDASEIIVT